MGASAIQIVLAIAPVVDQLTVFQRTAPWVALRLDKLMSARRQRLFRQVPLLRQGYRVFIYWLNELRAEGRNTTTWPSRPAEYRRL